jgi:amidase
MPLADDFWRAGAAELARRLRDRTVSSAELVDAFIARIERLDGRVNAVIIRDFERARADARAADARLAKGDTSALLGVPLTVKESFDIEGHPTTWGIPDLKAHRAREDAAIVQRLRAAGAVILGKTNVATVLADWQSDNPVYGRTGNPYDLDRSAGGSSGGSAAAIAMGFSAGEYGSDIGGSIRVPAAFCGLFGCKTTWGLVSSRGHMMGGYVGAPAPLGVVGPIARTAEDADLLLQVTAGPDDFSPANALQLPPPRRQKVGEYRVFVLDHHPVARIDSEVMGRIDALARRLVSEGATVARASNLLPDLMRQWRTYQRLLLTVTTRRAPEQDRQPISSHDLLDLMDEQYRVRLEWREFFRHFDVLVTPAFSTPAFPHTAEPNWRKRTLEIDGEATPYGDQLAWASMASLGNLPSISVPLGLSASGLPLAAQVIGPHLEDRMTIAFAGLVAEPPAPPALAA